MLAASFAYSAAKSGLRVVLVDCDFRHPSTTEYFGMQGKQGLVDVLTGAQTLEGALVTAGSIVVLAAGSPTQNPGDLLGSQRMKQVIANLRTAYDLIIIDTPPVAPVIDAKVITRLVDKIIFVVRWQSTPREIVSQCLDQLEADEKLAGIALNLINEAKSPRYGPYSYYSGNKYGSYYK